MRGIPPAALVVLAAVVFASLALVAGPHAVSDPDVFWLARAGDDLLRTRHFPTENGYAFTDPHAPWLLHEGLYAALFAVGMRVAGPAFVSLFALLSASAIVFLALRRIARLASGPLVTDAFALLLLLAAGPLFEPRPAFASLLFVVLMVEIAFAPGISRGRIALAVALEVVWTNAHGSFPLGVALLAWRAMEGDERAGWARVAALAAASTLLNPYGLGLHALFFRYLVGEGEMGRLLRDDILEFAPLHRAVSTPFVHAGQLVALCLALLAALRVFGDRSRRARASFVLLLVALSLYQARHLTLAVLAAAILLIPEGAAPPGWPRFPSASVLPGLVLGLGLFGATYAMRPKDDWIGPALGGAPFVRLSRLVPDGARVYAPFQPSAALLYFARGARVFFDPRNDCYSPETARAAFELEADDVAPARAARLLDGAGTDMAIVPAVSGVARALDGAAPWRRIGEDDGWVAYRRGGS